MGIFQSDVSKHQEKLSEEYLYGYVANEIANNHISPGLWAKAMVDTDGNEQKTQARYIKHRVEMLKSENAATIEAVQMARTRQTSEAPTALKTGTIAAGTAVGALATVVLALFS